MLQRNTASCLFILFNCMFSEGYHTLFRTGKEIIIKLSHMETIFITLSQMKSVVVGRILLRLGTGRFEFSRESD